MPESHPSFLSRIVLAFVAFFKVLFSGSVAYQFLQIGRGSDDGPLSHASEERTEPENPPLKQPPSESAKQVLSLLQREGRFVDFLQEDIASFSDEEIGAAVRVVHQGCKKVLTENFSLAPVHDETEGSSIVVEAGFESNRIRLTGNLVGDPPFRGTLQHRGWEITEVRLPKLAKDHDTSIIAPAEIEI